MKTITKELQTALDYAVHKMVEQGGRSLKALGTCAYSDGCGKRCAIGWLLNDAEIQPLSDVVAAVDELDTEVLRIQDGHIGAVAVELPDLISENMEIMIVFQQFHDSDFNNRPSKRKRLSKLGVDVSAPAWIIWEGMRDGI